MTLGEKGCVAFERRGAVHLIPAFGIEAIDSTGAGDAFAAAFCRAYGSREPLETALYLANAAGALTASRAGVLAALPTIEALRGLIRSRG